MVRISRLDGLGGNDPERIPFPRNNMRVLTYKQEDESEIVQKLKMDLF